MSFEGKVVLVTGASTGIGAATARLAAARGAHVLLVSRDRAALEGLASGIRSAGGLATPYPADLSSLETVAATCAAIQREVGTPDVLVNNAGAGRWLAVDETDPAEAVQMMAVPYFAAFAVTRAFLPAMLERDRGHVVNVTSPASFLPFSGAAAYDAARFALRGFDGALRAELGGTSLGVTLLVAGKVSSAYWEHNPGSEGRVPGIARLYRTLTPEEVGEALLDAVERRRRRVVIPFPLALTLALHQHFPGPVEWLIHRTGWRRPRRRSAEGAGALERRA
ncbi:MAG TPA: SDR family NAD(P)-dependent oxidoreductase [Anaeromyxobacteraceae bacterium]|nr:SDR family NAD(P)-dependent oxidoreductase [Anaeromyxobacteraceae bacterium]